MKFENFIASISDYEYFPYTHIMEIPKESLPYAKTLNQKEWNFIYEKKSAIALCCIIDEEINIVFSENCYQDNKIPKSVKIDLGVISINKSNLSSIIISAPRNKNGEIEFSDTIIEYGKIEIFSELHLDEISNLKDSLLKKSEVSIYDRYDFVIDMRKNHCGQVSIDNKLWSINKQKYQYLIQHSNTYYFSNDGLNIVEVKSILGVDLNNKEISNASFLTDDLFYYQTIEFISKINERRCGLISISKGEILKNDVYTSISHYIGEKYLVVDKIEHTPHYNIRKGLIDINNFELLSPSYWEINYTIQNDNSYLFQVYKFFGDKKWQIFDPNSKILREHFDEN